MDYIGSPNRETINHSSYGQTAPVEITCDPIRRYIPAKQDRRDPNVEPTTSSKPEMRLLTNELKIDEGGVYLSDDGLRNMEASLRKSPTPPKRLRSYYESYFGVRRQLERCESVFSRTA